MGAHAWPHLCECSVGGEMALAAAELHVLGELAEASRSSSEIGHAAPGHDFASRVEPRMRPRVRWLDVARACDEAGF